MNFRKLPYLILSLFLASTLWISCYSSEQRTPYQEKRIYSGIERTLRLLNSSTKEQPNSVEILFYGQSIIGGMKTNILVDSLRQRFPLAKISFKHKPIGGFIIPDLTKTVSHDVYQENPDLIVFHAYGGIKDGLFDALIKNIRKRTAADVLLLDHHYVWDKPQSRLDAVNEAHERDSKAIEEIAKKYGCGFVNVREQWRHYMDENNVAPNELMGNTIDPNVHPNDKGNQLLRQIVLSKFPVSNTFKDFSASSDTLREFIPIKGSDKQFKVKYSGAFTELLVEPRKNKANNAKVQVLINGKKPSAFKSSYHIERPSKGFKSWMPALSHVDFGKTLPRQEDWTIKIFDIDRKNKIFKFSLEGSITGFDGAGNNKGVFTSNSDRIVIDGEDFNIFRIERILKKETPENFEINFKVNQLAKDTLQISSNKTKYLLFRSNPSQEHKNEIKIRVVEGNADFKGVLISKPYITK